MDETEDTPSMEELGRIVGSVAASQCIQCVYLFGSRARGDNRPDSDYDLYVVPAGDCDIFRLSGFHSRLERILGEVDVVCEDPAERDGFVRNISKDMILLYSRDI